jgi:hypothetical protein
MGIDTVGLEAILLSLRHVINPLNSLTLARQQFHRNTDIINKLLEKYKYHRLSNKYKYNDYCETFFRDIGFNNIDSIDNNAYEDASIIHNLNYPFYSNKRYNFIYDGGTIEHIYNIPQVFENIINLLEIDGIYCSVTCNNNFSGHGFYQFSPEIFLSTFTLKYGMKIEHLYLAQLDSDYKYWLNVNNFADGRNITSFNSSLPVYIILIAKKISHKRENLILNCPNQFSYEVIDWK